MTARQIRAAYRARLDELTQALQLGSLLTGIQNELCAFNLHIDYL